MDDAFLAYLRCPIDPLREATLSREQGSLVCSSCCAAFPIKNGLPILIPEEAELPAGIETADRLPCVKAARRAERCR
ncbi:MAG TPA: Trm112 family protein [Urbifossiella sp.]|jgi:hypothetical protein